MNTTKISANVLNRAKEVLAIEAEAIALLSKRLDQPTQQAQFLNAVALLLHCKGRVVVSGIGKSGHIARKIASTLASTGTPAFFVHPAEASHGDLGMVTQQDVLVALSYSGESAELLTIVPLIKRCGAKLITMTGNPASSLAAEADVHLDAGVDKEACPFDLAPTASTTAALALGDALAMALLEQKGFTAEDFARTHPGGNLGRRLLTHVRDVMRQGVEIPTVAETAMFAEAILEMSKKGLGMTAVVGKNHQVLGIYTDGDLRRTLEKNTDLRQVSIASIMSKKPRTITPDQLAVEAVQIMEQHKVNQLLVVDDKQRLVGALNMHDLFRAKVI